MHKTTTHFKAGALLALFTLGGQAAAAEPLSIGVGAGLFPQFKGSEDYEWRALPSVRGSIGGYSFRTNGPGIELDLVRSRSLDAGPIVRYDFGRDPSDIDNNAVAALPEIDGSVQVGGFVQGNFPLHGPDDTTLSVRLSVLTNVGDDADGTQAEASVGLVRRDGVWTYGGRVGLTFASSDNMDTYFSVGPASPSGLAAYTAGSGIMDVGVSVFVNHKLTDNWSVTATGGYKRLLGDAADSPIVSVAGDENQGFVVLGVGYTFK